MPESHRGQLASITGAAGDIGRATRFGSLSKRGRSRWSITQGCRRRWTRPDSDARPVGAGTWVDTFDVTDADGVERSVRACRDAIGVPTALFNNAGYQGAFERIDRYPHVDAWGVCSM